MTAAHARTAEQETCACAGFVAGSASTAATYPLEALRTHISLGRRGGYITIVRDIVRERVIIAAIQLPMCTALAHEELHINGTRVCPMLI